VPRLIAASEKSTLQAGLSHGSLLLHMLCQPCFRKTVELFDSHLGTCALHHALHHARIS
jgi:hypothetical protein